MFDRMSQIRDKLDRWKAPIGQKGSVAVLFVIRGRPFAVENILDDVKKAFLEDVYSWSVLIGRIRAAVNGAYSKLLLVWLCLIKLN